MDKEKFVQNIKRYCEIKNVYPTVACRESGAGVNLINKLVTNGSIPSVEKVQLLAQYLGVTVSQLLGEDGPPGIVGGLSPADQELLGAFAQLNWLGQKMALSHINYLLGQDEYIKTTLGNKEA